MDESELLLTIAQISVASAGFASLATIFAHLKRAFEFDVTVCPLCGGTLRVIADITDPAIIDKILNHIRQSRAPPQQAHRRGISTDSNQRGGCSG